MIKKVLFGGKVELGISDIDDGNMRFFGEGDENEIIKNQNKLGELVNLGGNKTMRLRTIYDGRESFTDYFEITDDNLEEYCINNSESLIPVSDGLVTRCFNVGILLPLADCLGIVIYDEKRRIVGLLHAGRHNVEQFGPKKFVDFLVKDFGCEAKELKVFYSPHAVNYKLAKNDKKMADFATEQLLNEGVLLNNIINSKIDTVSNDSYPSHSKGDTKTRFAVIVKQID